MCDSISGFRFGLIELLLRGMGGDLGGSWGMFPKTFEVGGDGPSIRPPNIWRRTVIGCV